MAFVVKFSVSQSADGKAVTLTDQTNYGDGGAYHKIDMASRTLYITRGDDLVEQVVDFPFTNTNDTIQDTYLWSQTQDYIYSIKMLLVDTLSVEYSYTAQAITQEFTLQKVRDILSENGCGCGCNASCELVMRIECGLDAATARACAADISGAQQILEDINEIADNHINC